MIALIIIPLKWADPDSRKVLVHDDSKPSERFAGEDGEGFYYIPRAASDWYRSNLAADWMQEYCPLLVPCDMPLNGVASLAGELVAVYIEHFSAPTDYDDHFEDAPCDDCPNPTKCTFEPCVLPPAGDSDTQLLTVPIYAPSTGREPME